MSENILEIKDLTKDYGDFVLDKVSFALPRGVIMGLIGENGAGKSTTINCILNETRKTSGQILIFGKDHISMKLKSKINSAWSLMKTISLIFLRQRKSVNLCLEFTPAGTGRFTASILISLNCPRIRGSRISPKA